MGTEITLDVEGVSITYAKNHRGPDHGSLFQEQDRKRLTSDQLDYDHYIDSQEDPSAAEVAFIRPLKDVVQRLELLGFNLHRLQSEYEAVARNWTEERNYYSDGETPVQSDLMSFEEFREFATKHSLSSLNDTFVSGSEEEAAARGRFTDDVAIARIPGYSPYDRNNWSERSYFGSLVNILHPYSVIRLLAEGSHNQEAQVVWQYGPLVESGWAEEAEFVSGARRRETFLIATEGSSDVHILDHALRLLKPEVADFFRFIDVSESHPFSGTGNLVRFAEGLAKIDIQNQTLFVFDNDAEGLDAYRRMSFLKLPANMGAVMLPELEDFRDFPAQGPEGLRRADINLRAAAIECYLDLEVSKYPSAKVLWTNYKRSLDAYQGTLEHKESYVKDFLKLTPEMITNGVYNFKKIEAVVDLVVAECTAIAVKQWEHAD